jgi:RNA polymerase sigma factor for flagellar operon FliA
MSSAALSLYQQVQHEQTPESMILANMPMVKRVAIHLKARIPPFMDLDELIQVGMVGLIEAARAFDPSKGFEFEHFALSRVRGAILDEVRRLSFLPRSAVAFNRSESEAMHILGAELGRTPTQAEVAQYMGKDIDEFQKERGQAKRFETYSMEVVTDEVMAMPADSAQQPEVMFEEAEFMQAVVDAIDHLPEREKMVMSLYYVEELNLKEIGEVLGVTESRVSQILSTVVKKLRQELRVT